MSTTHLTVTACSWITPSIRRIHFVSDDLSGFAESVFTDRYVKLIFPKPGVSYPEQIDVRALRGVLPADELPDVRTYTALFPDVLAGTLAIDFVVHGDEGVAGPWAAAAEPGARLLVNGPGGGYRPDPTADWHLLIGDESAIPALAAALDALPESAIVRVVMLVESAAHEPVLTLPAGGTVTFVHRDGAQADDRLEIAVRAVDWLGGRVQVFAHGEAEEIMHGVRPYLRSERGLSRDQLSLSGYWRRGRTEDGFRAWKSELALAEGDALRPGGPRVQRASSGEAVRAAAE